MSKELIVSVNGREKKIAIVEDDVVTEFYVERGDENQGIVGNIYKGRVMKVLPGMQSAFVDIGLERDSFLYVSDFFDEEEEDRAPGPEATPRASRIAHRAPGGARAGRREGFRIADGRAAPHRGDCGGAGDRAVPRRRGFGSGIGRSGGRGRALVKPAPAPPTQAALCGKGAEGGKSACRGRDPGGRGRIRSRSRGGNGRGIFGPPPPPPAPPPRRRCARKPRSAGRSDERRR